MRQTKEYIDRVFEIRKNGGILYLIERTDTHEFLFKVWDWNISNHKPKRKTEGWSKEISFLTVGFLTLKDAEEEMKWMDLTEGGCYCCGHGSKDLPVLITEHEFLS
jgi:hypothetical protein